MTRYAEFDPTAPAPQPVIGWYDTGILYYPNLPPPESLVEVPDELWDIRMTGYYQVQDGELELYVPPPPPPPTNISVGQFLARFSGPEQAAFATAALASSPILRFIVLSLATQQIDLTAGATIDWMTALVGAGAITEERKTQILTP